MAPALAVTGFRPFVHVDAGPPFGLGLEAGLLLLHEAIQPVADAHVLLSTVVSVSVTGDVYSAPS